VADAQPSPLARAWSRRLMPRMTALAALPEPLRAALPPRWEALELEGGVAVRHGARRIEGSGFEAVPADAGDSLTSGGPPPVWLAPRSAWAATMAVVDSQRVLRGVLVASGGRDRTVRWLPVDDATRLPIVLDAVRAAADSVRRTRPDLRRGWTRVVPAAGMVRFVTPLYAPRSDGAPSLDAVVVADARGVGVGRSVVGAAGPAPSPVPALVATPDAAVTRTLYDRMRNALRRGDWVAFGAAFDALGRALGTAPDTSGP
jgi:hypothetical protein